KRIYQLVPCLGAVFPLPRTQSASNKTKRRINDIPKKQIRVAIKKFQPHRNDKEAREGSSNPTDIVKVHRGIDVRSNFRVKKETTRVQSGFKRKSNFRF